MPDDQTAKQMWHCDLRMKLLTHVHDEQPRFVTTRCTVRLLKSASSLEHMRWDSNAFDFDEHSGARPFMQVSCPLFQCMRGTGLGFEFQYEGTIVPGHDDN